MNIIWFKDIKKEDIAIVGGKAANLGEMYRIGLPVPPGFVITAQAYKAFINNIAYTIYAILDKVDVENSSELQAASQKIQEMIQRQTIPSDIKNDIMEAYEAMNIDDEVYKLNHGTLNRLIKAGRELPFVAVRSSATAEDLPNASFAGQQSTFLNVKGYNNLLSAVKSCWASLFTARAIYYRVKNNFPHRKVYIAVIVQKMVDSDKSGVIFSANPRTNDTSEIVINAAFGLGEAVVSGAINPDEYIIDKTSLAVKQTKVEKKDFCIVRDQFGKTVQRSLPPNMQRARVLNDYEINALAKLTKKIEEHYKYPQDIEFAIQGSGIYIVQTRAITTLEKKKEKREVAEKGIDISKATLLVKGLGASPGVGKGRVKIVHGLEDLSKIEHGDVLVARMTNPDYVPAMERSSAIVTDSGGLTCHASIVGREMGIPVIVGAMNATQVLKEGQFVTVDATTGKVFEGDVAVEHAVESGKEERGKVEVPTAFPSVTAEEFETVTKVKVMVDLPEHAQEIAEKTNAAGVGLLRCEFMLAATKMHPVYMIKRGMKQELLNRLIDGIIKIAQAFAGKPVWYRTSDFRTDEYRGLEGGEQELEEDNPMMGMHGIRRSLVEIELLKTEFEALRAVIEKGYDLALMLPMITHVEQVRKAKEIMKLVGLECKFGIMIETPAAVQIIEELCKEGIDFISFGTNDLTQFTLAVDRNNASVQDLYDEMHPAVLRQIKYVIDVCKKYGVETSICGQAGSRPEMAEFLVKAGIDSITVAPDAVHNIRKVVANTEKKLLLEAARKNIVW